MEQKYVIKKNDDGTEITVRMIQMKLLEIIKEIDRICQKHHIEYFLTGGSCLGAIRHDGFIPWDDDMDIGMSRVDYQKFIKVLETELSDSFTFHCYEKNKKYPVTWPAMKIRMKNTFVEEMNKFLPNTCSDCDGIFVDVFIYDYRLKSSILDFPLRFINTLLMMILVFFENLGINMIPIKELYRFNARIYGKISKHSSYFADEITWTFTWFPTFKYKYNDIYPTKKHAFENLMLSVPGNSHEYLKKNYGKNYMTPPPKEKKIAKHTINVNLESSEPESSMLQKRLKKYQRGLCLGFVLNIIALIIFDEISLVLCGLGMICIGVSIFYYLNNS